MSKNNYIDLRDAYSYEVLKYRITIADTSSIEDGIRRISVVASPNDKHFGSGITYAQILRDMIHEKEKRIARRGLNFQV